MPYFITYQAYLQRRGFVKLTHYAYIYVEIWERYIYKNMNKSK